jgi:hypothetical protein
MCNERALRCRSVDSGGNATAVEAISDKLSEVTGLAEQLDASLCGVQHGSNMKRILDGTAATTPEVRTQQPQNLLFKCEPILYFHLYSRNRKTEFTAHKEMCVFFMFII